MTPVSTRTALTPEALQMAFVGTQILDSGSELAKPDDPLFDRTAMASRKQPNAFPYYGRLAPAQIAHKLCQGLPCLSIQTRLHGYRHTTSVLQICSRNTTYSSLFRNAQM